MHQDRRRRTLRRATAVAVGVAAVGAGVAAVGAGLAAPAAVASSSVGIAGVRGWQAAVHAQPMATAPHGDRVARVTRLRGAAYALSGTARRPAARGGRYVAFALVRAASRSALGKLVRLDLLERDERGSVVRARPGTSTRLTRRFRPLRATAVARRTGNVLAVRLRQRGARTGDAFFADSLTLARAGTPRRERRSRPLRRPPRPAPAPAPPTAPAPAPAPITGLDAESYPYDPAALFNRPIPSGAPTDPRSAEIVGEFVSNTRSRKISVTVDGETPPVYVADASDSLYTMTIGGTSTRFRVPKEASAGGGSDYPIIVLDPEHPDHGRAVELRLWQAQIDHAVRRLSSSGGGLFHYNNDGVVLNPQGTRSESIPFLGNGTGSGLSYLAGLIRPEEVAAGEIRHAIRFAYGCNDSSAAFRAPAARTDQPHPACGANTTATPPSRRMDMGMRLQLDPAVNCETRRAPVLPGRAESDRETRFVRIVCRALQRYGMVMLDGTSPDGVNIYMENRLTAPWQATVGAELYGSYGYLLRDQSTPGDGLARNGDSGIPWERMRVVGA